MALIGRDVSKSHVYRIIRHANGLRAVDGRRWDVDNAWVKPVSFWEKLEFSRFASESQRVRERGKQ